MMQGLITSVVQDIRELPAHPVNAPLFRCPGPVPQLCAIKTFLEALAAEGLLELFDRIYLPGLGANGGVNWAGAGDDMADGEIPRPVGGCFTCNSGHVMAFVGGGRPVQSALLRASGPGGELEVGLTAAREITARMNEGPGNPARTAPAPSYAVTDALICLNRLHGQEFGLYAASRLSRRLTLLRTFQEGATGVPESPVRVLGPRPLQLITFGAGLTDAQLDAFCRLYADLRASL